LFPAALGKTGKLSRRPLVRTDDADTLKRRLKQDSVTLAGGGIFLAHLFPATLLRASAAGAQQSPSAADLLANMRAKFNAVPLQTQSLLTCLCFDQSQHRCVAYAPCNALH
jgi:hypothetical protein